MLHVALHLFVLLNSLNWLPIFLSLHKSEKWELSHIIKIPPEAPTEPKYNQST